MAAIKPIKTLVIRHYPMLLEFVIIIGIHGSLSSLLPARPAFISFD